MRQIATLPDESQARTLCDHLLALRIETRLERAAGGWEVWVCDEDQVPRAREEAGAFTANPRDERFTTSARAARTQAIRPREEGTSPAPLQAPAPEGGIHASPRGYRSLTLALMTTCLVVGIASNIGDEKGPVVQALSINSYTSEDGKIRWWLDLPDVRQGEVWRLVTPIFIHFGLPHLVFNLAMLYFFGTQIETRRGSLRFLALVLFLAAFSNLVQYHLGGTRLVGWRPVISSSPLFGGMSGVLYGLFGYLWMKGLYDPDLGLSVDPSTVAVLLGWFFLCMTGLVGPVANYAHAAGLFAGMAVGYAPTLWKRRRHPDV